MSYAVVVDVDAPVEVYDAVHAEMVRRTGAAVDGLLVHLAHPTPGGFRVVEVWRSRADFERYDADVVRPTMAEMAATHPGPAPRRTTSEIAVHGLVLADRGVLA